MNVEGINKTKNEIDRCEIECELLGERLNHIKM